MVRDGEHADDVAVLIVEDQALTADLHAEYVARCEGFRVSAVAHSGSEAIRAFRSGARVDLVLLDMGLPDMSGIDLCRSMRSAGLECDVIAVTAERDVAVVRSAMSLGIVQYLIKPFTFSAFADKLSTYRRFRGALTSHADADQHQIDASLALLRQGPSPLTLPKHLSPETLILVRAVLDEAGAAGYGVSATEVADRTSTSRATARRYLEYLAATGTAVKTSRYGGPGRPESEYRRASS